MNVELTENEAKTILNALDYCSKSLGVAQVMEFNELARISQKIAKAGAENAETQTNNESQTEPTSQE